MEFKYCRKNFGDELNHLIWSTLLKDSVRKEDNETSMFLGIGSILGMFKPEDYIERVVVFSSGYAAGKNETYGDIPTIDSRYDIYAVRGPKTAKILGLNHTDACLDGAYMLDCINFGPVEKKYKYGFMLNHESTHTYDWERFCEKHSLKYIHPEDDVLDVINDIRSCEHIVTEALHGGIVADLYGVPWTPIKIYKHINEFKWEDWWLSLDLNEVKFIHMPKLFSKKKIELNISWRIENVILRKILIYFYQLSIQKVNLIMFNFQIRKIKRKGPFYLSDRDVLHKKLIDLKERFERFRSNYYA